MVVYSNNECSNSLGTTVDVAVWDSLKAEGLCKRLGEWQVSLCHWLSRVFQWGRSVRWYRELDLEEFLNER